MTDDLISRQAAIDLFPNDVLEWDTFDGYIAPHEARRLIEDLPSAQPTYTDDEIQKMQDLEQAQIEKAFQLGREDAQPEPKWIPCSVKLPKKTDLYYVTIRDEDGTEYTSCMTYCINLARWEVEVNVIAWMPLPEPYEERKEE